MNQTHAVLFKGDGTAYLMELPPSLEVMDNSIPFKDQEKIKELIPCYEILEGGNVYSLPDIKYSIVNREVVIE